MDITKYLKSRELWQHSAPRIGTDRSEFDSAVAAKTALEIRSYAPGMYVSNFMPGEGGGYNPQPVTLRALGYLLTEHILTHEKWKGESRLQDLLSWGAGEKHINRLMVGNEPYYLNPDKPSQFEWLLWQSKTAAADVKDPSITRDTKQGELALIKEEVSRVSKIWSARKSESKSTGENVLSKIDKNCKDELSKTLKFMFGVLSVPSAEQFFPQYNPESLSISVKAGVALDERYQRPSDIYVDTPRDPFFDEEEELEEDTIVPEVSDEKKEIAKRCLTSFFIFEQGSAIISSLRSAKLQPGMRTVEPGAILEISKDIQQKFSIPTGTTKLVEDGFGKTTVCTAQLSYGKSVAGITDPSTNKSVKSYIYNIVDEKGNILQGPENEVLISAEAHKAIRKSTSPILNMPEGLPDKARYLEAKRTGRYPNMSMSYHYMDKEHKVFTISVGQHKQVMDLNPAQISSNVRGRIDDIFTDFFVDNVKAHYRGYLPDSREERILLRDKVKETMHPHVALAWSEINKAGGELEARTELAKKHYANWLKMFQLPEMKVVAPKLFTEMKTTQAAAVKDLITKRASETALVHYMEEMRGGENEAPNYKTYGLRGKYKTWKTQITSDGGKKALNERVSFAVAWAEKKYGSLDALVPETHNADTLTAHFTKGAGEELRELVDSRGIPHTKGLVGLTEHVNPISVLVFYERRLQHLEWNFHFDKPLPDVNLSRIAKAQQTEKIKLQQKSNTQIPNAGKDISEQEELAGIDMV